MNNMNNQILKIELVIFDETESQKDSICHMCDILCLQSKIELQVPLQQKPRQGYFAARQLSAQAFGSLVMLT